MFGRSSRLADPLSLVVYCNMRRENIVGLSRSHVEPTIPKTCAFHDCSGVEPEPPDAATIKEGLKPMDLAALACSVVYCDSSPLFHWRFRRKGLDTLPKGSASMTPNGLAACTHQCVNACEEGATES